MIDIVWKLYVYGILKHVFMLYVGVFLWIHVLMPL